MATETYTPDNLIAGTTQTVTDVVTIAAGAELTRGAVLGKITDGGKFTLCAALEDDGTTAVSDGSEAATAILAQDCDATAGDVTNVAVYVKGEFNANVLNFGNGHDVSTTKDALRDVGIYIKSALKA
jgi:hypothetical protein